MVTVADQSEKEPINNVHASQFLEAKEALLALGYTEKEVQLVMPTLQKEEITQTDEAVRRALALLVKN